MSVAAGPDAPSSVTRWVTVGRATELLGVNESTVRRWADSGKVRSFRTPGDHRRIAEQDLYALVGWGPEQRATGPDGEAAIEESRPWIAPARTAGRLFSALSAEQRQQYRPLGRRLVGLAGDYVSGRERRADVEHAVDEIGRRYGRLLVEHGAGLNDAIETFILFRGATLDAAEQVIGRRLLGHEEYASAREQIAALLDRVLIQLAGAFAGPADAHALQGRRRAAAAAE